MPADDPRQHRLFRDHPEREVTLPWGTVVRLPFHAYRAATWVIAGTAKLEALARWLVPEGLVPIRLRDRDGLRGAAWVWCIDYLDSNYGSFQQVVVAFAAARDTFDLPCRNAASPLAALTHPSGRAFLRWMFTTDPDVVTLGREVWGFPSEEGRIAWSTRDGRFRASVAEESGREVLDLDVRDRSGLLRRIVGSLRAGRAMGWEQAASFALSPALPLTVITPTDVKRSRTPVRLHGTPTLYRWKPTDTLRLGTRSEGGAALADLGFRPTVVLRHDDLRFAILSDPKTLGSPPSDRIRYEDDL